MSTCALPPLIYGTSVLGNLYEATSINHKLEVVKACMQHQNAPVYFDSAGKYGAGLALESLGQSLEHLQVNPNDVVISNKLGWFRKSLTSSAPTFEPGVWKDLKHDAEQKISYHGILACYLQGNMLLGKYKAKMVSVHDPDEYLQAAADVSERKKRYRDIIGAYKALLELKAKGEVASVGIGAKDWRTIARICRDVQLDWVMLANSLTIHSHPREVVEFMEHLRDNNISIINAAVFNGGFVVGADYYNYSSINSKHNSALYQWRSAFFNICSKHNVTPAQAAAAFAFRAPGVNSIALSAGNPGNVHENSMLLGATIAVDFWATLVKAGLIDEQYFKRYLKNN
ncbi:aldo/keto reductase [Mucilaginibacter aquatilis]|uniref:Aldo/keto reductase n=1 Tax=Mucilaginibacter aquatilis TaxID=1517760 RepID=A0A6I4IRF9_9SPHI|nr:aldo/keto reductase [Mucilaginibacter aquatilis]MVN92804.1 aldo/keto reductase [Mucilaginibacter aquatilis]